MALRLREKRRKGRMYAKAVDRFPAKIQSGYAVCLLAEWWGKQKWIVGAEREQIVALVYRAGDRRRSSAKSTLGPRTPEKPEEWVFAPTFAEKIRMPLQRILRESIECYKIRSVDDMGALIMGKITSLWVQICMEAPQILSNLANHEGGSQYRRNSLCVVNFGNGNTLGFSDEKQINNANVVGHGKGTMIVVRLCGGAIA
ncbi:hypothetical protein PHPALM_19663 [Phytophthora palmivora]|uniref:Uncharacterized protein n=1 Tax=Phytophthora palmivora TaxID=4796 RepID=A0A2P4XGV2_9STRA|nr:hypothetical protein PHPALM_19663 [Phytophthora palmivora]